jgi:NAD(P)-dependent dehydrogenase (short-subunit alcohol dehydrogenase family)
MGTLDGQVAIITGGTRGIGRATAEMFAAHGANLALCSRSQEALDETAKQIRDRHGVKVFGRAADILDAAAMMDFVRQVADRYGRVDILVNNAGVIKLGPVVAFSEDDWDLIIDVNVKGTFLCTKAVIPHMTQRGSGRIVNLSSIAGKRGRPFASAYCTSKWAVIGFTQSLAYELAPANINVNAICPGEVDTYMWRDVILPLAAAGAGTSKDEAWSAMIERDVPLKRPQTVEDMGQAVVFLCEADNITGIAMNVSGGTEMN